MVTGRTATRARPNRAPATRNASTVASSARRRSAATGSPTAGRTRWQPSPTHARCALAAPHQVRRPHGCPHGGHQAAPSSRRPSCPPPATGRSHCSADSTSTTSGAATARPTGKPTASASVAVRTARDRSGTPQPTSSAAGGLRAVPPDAVVRVRSGPPGRRAIAAGLPGLRDPARSVTSSRDVSYLRDRLLKKGTLFTRVGRSISSPRGWATEFCCERMAPDPRRAAGRQTGGMPRGPSRGIPGVVSAATEDPLGVRAARVVGR